MIISKEKLEKIKALNTDDSDFVLKINEYLNHKHEYIENTEVFENIELLKETLYQKEQGNATLYLLFSTKEQNLDDLNVLKVENGILNDNEISSDMFYSGKEYYEKIEKYQKEVCSFINDNVSNGQNLVAIIDVSGVSSYPLWNTVMRRSMKSIIKLIESEDFKDISHTTLTKLIKNSHPENVLFDKKYDLDFFIVCMKELAKKQNITFYFIDDEKTNESVFLTNELIKFSRALAMEREKRYEYIYDTICKDMDEMFSKYGFCNFKENKCVAQRHKTLFNRYPVPNTDGCCFKVVRKCEHNNKDGTCKVKCLPCKLFTCPYLGKLHVGIRASELILMRAFLNNRQKRTSIYKFYNTKEFLLEKIKGEE